VLDLSNKGPGIYNLPVALVAPDVVVQSLSPASVTLNIERIEQRAFPITAHYVGTQTGIVVSDTQIHPDSAIVRAATSVLAQVSAVRADVALSSEPKVIDEMVRPIAVDSGGAEVSGLTVAPNLVRIQLHLAAGKSATP
jgi:YbbR domain-containing protein